MAHFTLPNSATGHRPARDREYLFWSWVCGCCLPGKASPGGESLPFQVVPHWNQARFLQVKMTHIQDGGEHVLLLLYDPKTNQTFLPASSRGTVRSALHQAVDTVLKKTFQDHQSGLLLPLCFLQLSSFTTRTFSPQVIPDLTLLPSLHPSKLYH